VSNYYLLNTNLVIFPVSGFLLSFTRLAIWLEDAFLLIWSSLITRPTEMSTNIPQKGQKIKLKLIRESVFPDNREYYLLVDEHQQRFLLPAEYYRSYGLKPGTRIDAVVDHVNCNGRIFLEPEHPRFKTGSMARFGIKVLFSSPGGFMPSIVTDVDGLEYSIVFPPGSPPPGSAVLLNIKSISKGMVYPEWPAASSGKLRSPELPVMVDYLGTYSLQNDEKYHLLVYEQVPALIKSSLFPWFNPLPGQKVKCLLYNNKNGVWRAEPVNPFYPFREKRIMEVVRAYSVDDLLRGIKQWLDVKDESGRLHTILVGAVSRYEPGQSYPFIVSGYRKGRIVWEEI